MTPHSNKVISCIKKMHIIAGLSDIEAEGMVNHFTEENICEVMKKINHLVQMEICPLVGGGCIKISLYTNAIILHISEPSASIHVLKHFREVMGYEVN